MAGRVRGSISADDYEVVILYIVYCVLCIVYCVLYIVYKEVGWDLGLKERMSLIALAVV